jgi:hypothetical protein
LWEENALAYFVKTQKFYENELSSFSFTSEGKARESLLKGRLSTVDLQVKIACFGKKKKNIV